jgi:hypothetical protein
METIAALIFIFVIFAIPVGMVVVGITLIRAVVRTRRAVPPPIPNRLNTVTRAFLHPFDDGTSDLASALPDNLLLEQYRANLAKIAKHKGNNLEQFSADLGEMLIIHMEIANRFAAYSDRKARK